MSANGPRDDGEPSGSDDPLGGGSTIGENALAPPAGARRVRDYAIGFGYRARLYRCIALEGEGAVPGQRRFALLVERPAHGAREPDADLALPLEVASWVVDGEPDRLAARTPDGSVELDRNGDVTDIDTFVSGAADVACEHLGVERGSFRPIAGSEPPPPWAVVDPDARLCAVCGSPLPSGDDSCAYCGGPPR